MPADNILQVDFGARIVLIADRDRGSGDFFKARVLYPQFISVSRINRYRCGNAFYMSPNNCETGFVFFDGSHRLTLEGGVKQRKLPTGGRLAGHDSILATIEVQVLNFVANIVKGSDTRA